jgi:hypothetical protein
MKKVVLASLLAAAAAASLTQACYSQAATPNLGTQSAGGQIQMSADEYAAYNNAITQTTPATKAAAFDAYLKAYPKSAVKADALQQEMFAYSGVPDNQKTLDTADALLAVDPNNLYAYVFEVSLRGQAAAAVTDPAAKQAGLDAAASYAVKGLAATKPAAMSPADFTKLTAGGYPYFYAAIGASDLNKKDQAGAIKAFNSELASVPVATTEAPGPQLMDTYLNCAYYAARAANYAPEPFKTTFTKLGTYCYTKYHGKPDGYDAVTAIAKDNLVPPATYPASVTPAPTPTDIVADLIKTTPDLATLALSDKEYVLQNGKSEDADKVFGTIKGKSVEIPGAIVVSATADTLTVAVSDDSQQAQPPFADFTFTMKEPLKTIPAVGDKITLDGTYSSYTQKPLMITMSDGVVVPPPTPKKPTVRRPTTHH